MKKTITLAAVLASGAAALLAVQTADNGAPETTPAPRAAPAQAVVPVAQDAPRHIDISESAEAKKVVRPLARKDRGCRVELSDYVTPDGEVFAAYRCIPKAPRPPHPLAHYDNSSLEVLAWSDPEAAALLGRRLAGAERRKAHEMLIRATALDGDVGHLSWLADQAFSAVRIDGELQINNVKRRYELAALASKLGGDPAIPRYLRQLLVDEGLSDSSLDALDARVEALLESVHDIQRAVHGEVRFGGQNDA